MATKVSVDEKFQKQDFDLFEALLALDKKDYSTASYCSTMLGKYLAMFTDKSENKTEIIIKPEEKSELQNLRGNVLNIN